MRRLRFALIVLVLVGLAFAIGTASPPPTVESLASVASGANPSVEEPGRPAEVVAPVGSEARTTIAILRISDGGDRIELVNNFTKQFACAPTDDAPGETFYVLEDAVTGARLATGPCPLPELCRCDGPDHRDGCRRVRHEAVVRLKLPRVASTERLTIHGPDGPIAQFALEGA